jgi:hypothetical protein
MGQPARLNEAQVLHARPCGLVRRHAAQRNVSSKVFEVAEEDARGVL